MMRAMSSGARRGAWSVSVLALAAASATWAAGSWQTVGDMGTGRFAPSAVLLGNGQVLVAGGYDGAEMTASAQLFGPSTVDPGTVDPGIVDPGTVDPGTVDPGIVDPGVVEPAAFVFAPTGSMLQGRGLACAAPLPNGNALVAGGNSTTLGTLNTAEVYETAAGLFRATSTPMKSRREQFTATPLPNGRVLLVGGYNAGTGESLATAELYDPSTDRFTATGSLSIGRYGHGAVYLPSVNKVLVVGGSNISRSRQSIKVAAQRTAELYDVATGKFTRAKDMAYTREQPEVAWVPALRKALVVGGRNGQTDLRQSEWFNPSGGGFQPGPSLAVGRTGHSLTQLLDGSVLVAGGRSSVVGGTVAQAERLVAEAPTTTLGRRRGGRPGVNTFSPYFEAAGSLTVSSKNHAAALLPDGRVLVTGGIQEDATGAGALPTRAETYTR